MKMNVKIPLFEANALDTAKLNPICLHEFDTFYHALHAKIGRIISTQRRLYRVPFNDDSQSDHLYALLVLNGEKADSMIEVMCSASVRTIKWPDVSDIERGKRLCIEVVDWIDAVLLIEYLVKEHA